MKTRSLKYFLIKNKNIRILSVNLSRIPYDTDFIKQGRKL